MEKYGRFEILLCFVLAFLFLDASSVQADRNTSCENDAQVCQRLLKIQIPEFLKPDQCYEKAKNLLQSEHAKNSNVSEGSMKQFLLLTENMDLHKDCRDFLVRLSQSSNGCELQEIKSLFGNSEKESLDRMYSSYQTCQDLEKSDSKKNSSPSSPPASGPAQEKNPNTTK